VTVFLLFFAAPATPAATMCGNRVCTTDQQERIIRTLGLDRPLTVQYAEYMKAIFVGRTIVDGNYRVDCPAPCLGISFRTNQPVLDIIKLGFPVTASLVLGGAFLWLTTGILLGTFAALRRGGPVDKFSIGFSLTGASMQIYVLGLVLMVVFVYNLHWLPRPSYTSPFENPFRWAAGRRRNASCSLNSVAASNCLGSADAIKSA